MSVPVSSLVVLELCVSTQGYMYKVWELQNKNNSHTYMKKKLLQEHGIVMKQKATIILNVITYMYEHNNIIA